MLNQSSNWTSNTLSFIDDFYLSFQFKFSNLSTALSHLINTELWLKMNNGIYACRIYLPNLYCILIFYCLHDWVTHWAVWQLVVVHCTMKNSKHNIPYIAKIYTFLATSKFRLITVHPLSLVMTQYHISFTKSEFPIKSLKTIFHSAQFH